MENRYKRYKVDPTLLVPERTRRRHRREKENQIMLDFGQVFPQSSSSGCSGEDSRQTVNPQNVEVCETTENADHIMSLRDVSAVSLPSDNYEDLLASDCNQSFDSDYSCSVASHTGSEVDSSSDFMSVSSTSYDSGDTTEPLSDTSRAELELVADADEHEFSATFSFDGDGNDDGLDQDTVFEDLRNDQRNAPLRLRQWYGDMSQKLCECTDTTQGETLVAVLSIGMRHSLSYAAMTDILQLINVLYKRDVIPATYYSLLKHAEPSRVHESIHPICPECANYIGEAATETALQCDCGHVVQSPLRSKEFVMSLGMKEQIKELFEKPDISQALDYRFTRAKVAADNLEDVYDGALYKKMSSDGMPLSNRNNFSYSFNTDGVKFGNSSTQQLWPIYLSINELPPKLRSRNVLLVGLFVGKKKPNMLVMLQPFVNEANHLSNVGLEWDRDGTAIISKVIPLFSVVDTQARWPMLNHKQFSGYYGCTYCDMAGEFLNGSVRYTMLGLQEIPTDRTDANYRDTMLMGYNRRNHPDHRKRHYKGSRGPCVLMNLDYFDLIAGMPPDSMHFLKGVVEQNLNLILTKLDDDEISRISDRILALHPPSVLTRTPRALKERECYKANEFRALLIIYGPVVMHDIVPSKYLTHFCLLSSAFHLLMQKSISHSQLEYTSRLLVMYVTLYEKYYGGGHMTYNVHLLLHVVKSVVNLGPTWTHTCYPFEGQNRYLVHMAKSPLEIAKGVARRYSIYNNLPKLCDKFNVCDEILNFCNGMFIRSLRWATRSDGVTLLGQPKEYNLTDEEIVAAREDCQGKIFRGNVVRFQKFILDGLRFTTSDYNAAFKRDDSGIFHLKGGNNKCKITNIIMEEGDYNVIIFAREMIQVSDPIWKVGGCQLKHIRKIRCEGKLLALRPTEIGGQCMFMETDSGTYVTSVPYGCRGD